MNDIMILTGSGCESGLAVHVVALARIALRVGPTTLVADRITPGHVALAGTGVRLVEIPGLDRFRPRARALIRVAALVRELRPAVLWTHGFLPSWAGRLALLAEGRAGLRPTLLSTIHGAPFGPGRPGWRDRVARPLERAALACLPAHDILCVSAADRDLYAPLAGRHRLHVVPNAAPPLPPAPALLPPHGRRVLVPARAARQKRPSAALAIHRHLRSEGWEMVLAGPGTGQLSEPPSGLHGLGPLPRERMAGLYRACDVVLLPSRYEGMPYALLEAMEHGLPVAASPVGGAAEILERHPLATAIDPDAPREAAERIRALLARYDRDRALWRQRIRAAAARHFSFSRWQRRMEGLLREAHARATASGRSGSIPETRPA